MQPATPESLATIRIVYCAPDTCLLYGIPYEMREGQAPRHLWEANRTRFDRPVGRTVNGAPIYLPDPLEGWIYLGDSRDPLVVAWLARVRERDGLPGWPHEWQRIEPLAMDGWQPGHSSGPTLPLGPGEGCDLPADRTCDTCDEDYL